MIQFKNTDEYNGDLFQNIDPKFFKHSIKWANYPILGLWIADMDFSICSNLAEKLNERLKSPLGYGVSLLPNSNLRRLIIKKADQHGFSIEYDGIFFLPAVVQGLYAAVAAFSNIGDDVVCVTPIYPPFHKAINLQNRKMSAVPLIKENTWKIDWQKMEEKITVKTKLLMFCHPHNPTGRVWNEKELKLLADFAREYDLIICSDELHADLIHDEKNHFKSMAHYAPERTLVLTGPGKSYNVAALSIGAILCANPDLLKKLIPLAGLLGTPAGFSAYAWEQALLCSDQWLKKVKNQLKNNRQIVIDWIKNNEMLDIIPPQATYLAWIDASRFASKIDQNIAEFLELNGVLFNDGRTFAPENIDLYNNYFRLNFATSKEILKDAIEKVNKAMKI